MKELIIYQDASGGWEAEYPKLPGFRARGATREEAIERLKQAIKLYEPCRCED